jgi:ParB family transcriptional regulator, chromosome partitioning protein
MRPPTPSSSPSATQTGRRRLGRGLSSLLSAPVKVDLPDTSRNPRQTATGEDASVGTSVRAGARTGSGELLMIAVDAVAPNEYQPRRHFDESALEALAASIREAGMMQPVVVRPRKVDADGDALYELIAGERRWRAAQKVGLAHIPAVVRDVDHKTAAQWALIENIQREDLNAIERAQAFRRLAEEFALTHQEIAERVGLDRTSVTNHLRLLELSPEILDAIAAGGLGMGHGRALLAITNLRRRSELALTAAREGWSVRELERGARAEARPAGAPAGPGNRALPPHIEDLQRRLGEHLGSKVQIQPGPKKGAGKITVEFYSLDEFEGILSRLGFDPS